MIESVGADRARLRWRNRNAPVQILPLEGDRTQVEENERVLRPVVQLAVQDPDIALQLSGSQCGVRLASVPHDQIGPPDRDVRPPQGGQDLLVNPLRPAHILAEWKQPDMIDHGLATGPVGRWIARATHDIGRRVFHTQSVQQGL